MFDSGWPPYDAALAREQTVELAVQVNGKLRGTVRIPTRCRRRKQALRRGSGGARHRTFCYRPDKKVIFVRGRLLNIVV